MLAFLFWAELLIDDIISVLSHACTHTEINTFLVQFTVLIKSMGVIYETLYRGGIARLSVNTLELAGGFTVIFPVLLAHALLPSHCFPRFTQSLVHKRSVVVVVVVVLAKPCT